MIIFVGVNPIEVPIEQRASELKKRSKVDGHRYLEGAAASVASVFLARPRADGFGTSSTGADSLDAAPRPPRLGGDASLIGSGAALAPRERLAGAAFTGVASFTSTFSSALSVALAAPRRPRLAGVTDFAGLASLTGEGAALRPLRPAATSVTGVVETSAATAAARPLLPLTGVGWTSATGAGTFSSTFSAARPPRLALALTGLA